MGDPFPHSMEPQLRQLGLNTTLVRGVPSLNNPHVLCRKGEKLTSEKCRILKLLGVQMSVSAAAGRGGAEQGVGLDVRMGCERGDGVRKDGIDTTQEFRIHLGSRWSKGEGFVAGEDKATDGDAADEVEDGAMDEDED
jgi:mRNA turnover protein 4